MIFFTFKQLSKIASGVMSPLLAQVNPANAPTTPFNTSQMGAYQRQPNGEWQRAQWDGSSWIPVPGDYADPTIKQLLDESRQKLLDKSQAERDAIEEALQRSMPLGYTPPLSAVSPAIGTTPDPLVKKIIYVDPLILDLDGDGLEITPLSKGILFDANGDTIKTGTAWAGSDDGMLVWDRNGNGQIDSGAELFGDETVLANGKKAAHGFAALAELDSNADGKFDALDAQYANLRVWRDLNQDGISQADELQGLQASGVQSVQLTSVAPSTPYTDAILAQSGSFTRSDGSTGQAGSFILAQNNFIRAFTPITVSEQAKTLPNLGGSGWPCSTNSSSWVIDNGVRACLGLAAFGAEIILTYLGFVQQSRQKGPNEHRPDDPCRPQNALSVDSMTYMC